MKKDIWYISLLVLLSIFSTSCSNSDSNELSVTVKGTVQSDGSMEFSEPSEKEIHSIGSLTAKLELIDKKHPGPTLDQSEMKNFIKVRSINKNGTLALENGKQIAPAGCECGANYFSYLKRVFISEQYRIHYIPTGYEKDGIIFSYIWEIHIDEEAKPEEYPIGLSSTSHNETALLNNYCTPIPQRDHKFYERYIALSNVY